MITTGDGKPIEFIIMPASVADITAFRLTEIDLPQGASIYRDKAYTQYSFEDDLPRLCTLQKSIVMLPLMHELDD